jgi:hypothetical protein
MKMFKMLLAVMMVTGITFNAIADENTPMITDGVMDLEKYLFGDVDSNGQTILHRIVANCDNDDFTVRLKLFDFLENFEKSEGPQLIQSKVALYSMISHLAPDQNTAALAILIDMNNFVQTRDNNGATALDIAKKRNALNPHKRCTSCVELLGKFEELNKQLNR